MKRLALASLLILALTACVATESGFGFQAVTEPGLASPFTEHCQSIRIEQTYNGIKTLIVTLSDKNPGEFILGAPSTPYTVVATCLDSAGNATGSTTRALTTYNTEVGSSEGSTLKASYAQQHQTSGIFPIVLPK